MRLNSRDSRHYSLGIRDGYRLNCIVFGRKISNIKCTWIKLMPQKSRIKESCNIFYCKLQKCRITTIKSNMLFSVTIPLRVKDGISLLRILFWGKQSGLRVMLNHAREKKQTGCLPSPVATKSGSLMWHFSRRLNEHILNDR